MSDEPVLIWGAGAIGGTLAAWWARAGVPVLAVDTQRDHVEACRTTGLRIDGPVDAFTQVVPAKTPDELTGVYRRVVLAVKAQATEAATDALAKPSKRRLSRSPISYGTGGSLPRSTRGRCRPRRRSGLPRSAG